jgi:hypothetical protein
MRLSLRPAPSHRRSSLSRIITGVMLVGGALLATAESAVAQVQPTFSVISVTGNGTAAVPYVQTVGAIAFDGFANYFCATAGPCGAAPCNGTAQVPVVPATTPPTFVNPTGNRYRIRVTGGAGAANVLANVGWALLGNITTSAANPTLGVPLSNPNSAVPANAFEIEITPRDIGSTQKGRIIFNYTVAGSPCNYVTLDMRFPYVSTSLITGPTLPPVCVIPGQVSSFFFPAEVSANAQLITIGTDTYQWLFSNGTTALPTTDLGTVNPTGVTQRAFSGDRSSVRLGFDNTFVGMTIGVRPGACNATNAATNRGFASTGAISDFVINPAPAPITLDMPVAPPTDYIRAIPSGVGVEGTAFLKVKSVNSVTLTAAPNQPSITYTWTIPVGYSMRNAGSTGLFTEAPTAPVQFVSTTNAVEVKPLASGANDGGYSGVVSVRTSSATCGAAANRTATYRFVRDLDPAINQIVCVGSLTAPFVNCAGQGAAPDSTRTRCANTALNLRFTNLPLGFTDIILDGLQANPGAAILPLPQLPARDANGTFAETNTYTASTAATYVPTYFSIRSATAPTGTAGQVISARRAYSVLKYRTPTIITYTQSAARGGLSTVNGWTYDPTTCSASILFLPSASCVGSFTYNWGAISNGSVSGLPCASPTNQRLDLACTNGNATITSINVPAGIVCGACTTIAPGNIAITTPTFNWINNTCGQSNKYRPGKKAGLGSLGTDAKLNVAPNPAETELQVEVSGSPQSGGTISVMDAKGVQVMRQKADDANTTLLVKELPAGLYSVLYLSSEGERLTTTFVKR